MTATSDKSEAKVRVVVDENPVPTSFEKWAKPGHFDRTLAKGPKTTEWIWTLHADAHDFDSFSSEEDTARKIFFCSLWAFGHYFYLAQWHVFPRGKIF